MPTTLEIAKQELLGRQGGDGLSLAKTLLAEREAEPAEEGGGILDFFQGIDAKIADRLQERGEEFRAKAPPTTVGESLGRGVQVLGMGAGGVLDVIGEVASAGGEGLKALFDKLPEGVKGPIVDFAKEDIERVTDLPGTQAGLQAASEGIEAYQAWAAENREVADTLESGVNLALLFAPTPKRGAPTAPTAVGRAGQRAEAAAVGQEQATRATFVDDLVRPKGTKAVREAEILRTSEGGLTSGRTVTPSAAEQRIATTVTDVAGVTPKNTLLENLGVIQAEIGTEAKSLASILEASTVKIGRPDIKSSMDDVITRLEANPLLVGDAAKTGERTVAKARSLLAANPNTPAGVLKARQQFDTWVGNQRPKIFDPNTESALSIAVRETRQEMNDIIARNAPETGVKASLARQSDMFRALDNIAPKAADEASTAIGRLGQRVKEMVGLKRSIRENLPQIATLGAVGLGGLAAPATLVGAAAIIGLGLGGRALAMSPATKRAVSQLLQQTDKAIRAAADSPEVLKQLRLDRAAVIEVLRNSEGSE